MCVFCASKSDGENISQQTTHCGVIKWIDLECQIGGFPKINCKLMKKYSSVSGFRSVKIDFMRGMVTGSPGFFCVEENQPIKSKVNQMHSLLFFNINIFINDPRIKLQCYDILRCVQEYPLFTKFSKLQLFCWLHDRLNSWTGQLLLVAYFHVVFEVRIFWIAFLTQNAFKWPFASVLQPDMIL